MRAKSVSAELCQTAEAKVFLTGLEEAWILAPARSSSLRMKDGSTCDASNCDDNCSSPGSCTFTPTNGFSTDKLDALVENFDHSFDYQA